MEGRGLLGYALIAQGAREAPDEAGWIISGVVVLLLSEFIASWALLVLLGLIGGTAERWPRRRQPGRAMRRIWLSIRVVAGTIGCLLILLFGVLGTWEMYVSLRHDAGVFGASLILALGSVLVVGLSLMAWSSARRRRRQRKRVRIGESTHWRRAVPPAPPPESTRVQLPGRQGPVLVVRWLVGALEIAYAWAFFVSFSLIGDVVGWGTELAGALSTVVFLGWPLPLLALQMLRKRRTRRQTQAAAERLGLQFSTRDPFDLTVGEEFSIFAPRHGRAENVIWGIRDGMRVMVFDLPVRRYPGVDYVCGVLDLTSGPHPHVRIGPPRPAWLEYDPSLSWHHPSFESIEFNQLIEVTTNDRRFAHEVVDARMMGWLMGLKADWRFEVQGNRLLCFRPVVRRFVFMGLDLSALGSYLTPYPPPKEVLDVLFGFRRRMPRTVEPALQSEAPSPAELGYGERR